MIFYSFISVWRAARVKSALSSNKKRQWILVSFYQEQQTKFQSSFPCSLGLIERKRYFNEGQTFLLWLAAGLTKTTKSIPNEGGNIVRNPSLIRRLNLLLSTERGTFFFPTIIPSRFLSIKLSFNKNRNSAVFRVLLRFLNTSSNWAVFVSLFLLEKLWFTSWRTRWLEEKGRVYPKFTN